MRALWLKVVAFLALALPILLKLAKAAGKREQRAETNAEAAQARIETIEQSKEKADEVKNLDADERARRFDGLW